MPSDQPQYTKCYVAFVDILGFGDLVQRSERDADVLCRLVLALNEAADLEPSEKWVAYRHTGVQKHWRMQVRAFSDSIALFVPTESRLIASVLESVGYLHDRFLEMHCCVRGAVTIGNMYWHDAWSAEAGHDEPKSAPHNGREKILYEKFGKSGLPITLGRGLIEAYCLERHEAKYPRVLIGDKVCQYIAQIEQGERWSRVPASPLCSSDRENACLSISNFLRTDSDGLKHLDMLHPKRDRQHLELKAVSQTEDGKTAWRKEFNTQSREEWLRAFREFILGGLQSPKDPSVREKYEWLAKYFNSCLAAEKDMLSTVHRIQIE